MRKTLLTVSIRAGLSLAYLGCLDQARAQYYPAQPQPYQRYMPPPTTYVPPPSTYVPPPSAYPNSYMTVPTPQAPSYQGPVGCYYRNNC